MEYLILTIGGLLAERVIDYAVRRNAATKELIRKVSRAVFDRLVAMMGDDKDRVYETYNGMLAVAMTAVKIRPSNAAQKITDVVFNELWEARRHDLWDTAMAELKSAGGRAEKLGTALAKLPPGLPKDKLKVD
jgi:hypothetical protein